MENYCGSEFWNTNLTWNTEDPELTRCFENTVLIWIPCIFLWMFSSLEVYYILSSKKHHIPWSWLNIAKLVVTSILIVICVSDLITSIPLQSTNSKPVYNVIIYTPIFKLLTFGLSFVLVYYNKKHGLQVSGVHFIFWFLLATCGAFQFRSEIRNAQNDTLEFYSLYISYLIYYPLVVFMFILNCFADKTPVQSSTNKELERLCPEENSGFPSRLLFSWFDSFAWKGFRNPLELDDLWKIRTADSAEEVTAIVDHHWKNTLIKTGSSLSDKASYKSNSDGINLTNSSSSNSRQASILPALIKTFGWPFLFGCFLKLSEDALTFASPQLLSLLINYAEYDEETWKGYLYAVLLFAVAILQTALMGQYYKRMFVIGMRVRTALVSMIYRKALKMSTIARKESTVGEIVNLMSVDAQRFVDFMPFANLIWSAPLQIIVSLYFLWKLLGPSVLAGLAVMVLMFPLTGYVAEKMQSLMMRHMKSKDERVKLINEVLSGMKILKLYAWEPSFENQISKIRNGEINILRQLAIVNAAAMFIWTCAPFMIILATFAVYILVDESHVLDAQTAFVSISLFNILKFPLSMLPYMVSNFAQILVSIKRINKFLNSEELDSTCITHKDEGDPIIIENGTFSWGEDPVLRNINLRLKGNSLSAVVGTVGCGKSSLISSILGEMQKIEGRVNIFGSIGYVSQQAWIQNATLKDNILFGNPLDEGLYRRVIKACALKPDIEMLPGGDQTEIGEKGINLSGGQKQRVNLARAVYANCDIYFLDDPLSAVDSHVGKHIFEQLIGPNGLLKDKTRVLVTHGITYLPYADKIVVLKNGEISEMGSYNELLEKKGAFSEFILNHISEKVDATDEELDELNEHLSGTAVSEEVKKKFQRLRSRVSESVSETGADGAGERSQERERIARQRSSISTEPTKIVNVGEKLIEEETSEIGRVKWAVYKHYLKSIGLFLAIVTIFCDFIFQGFSIGTNVWLSVWSANVNDTVDNPKKRDMYLGVYGALGVGQAITSVFAGLAPALGCCFASKILHQSLLKSILRAPMSFFDTTPLGRILSRFSKDIDVVDTQLPWLVYNTAFSFFEVIGTIAVISFTTPIFMTVVLPIGILYYLAQQFYIGTSRQLKRLESVTRSPIYSHFSETLTGVQMIRAFGAQDRFINEAYQKFDKNQICYFPSIIADRWLAVRLEIVGNLIIFFSALFLVISKESNAGLVGLSVTYALQITQTLNWLVRQVAAMETDIVAVERIKEYSETEPEAAWEIANKKPPSLWPESGSLQFKRYSLRYRPGLELVLKGVSFSIKGGEKIGIVGRTGAGKSSLTMGLFRLIEAAEGEILIDGVNISQLGLHDLRSKLTIIPQDAVLFSGTLRLNLDPFDKYSDEELWRALEYAHLKDFIKGLSADLQHEITEGGESLSVGQRQLVCLSRALLRKSRVLILDEATAAVDLETDDLIQRTIRTEFKDCTVLTIAHRINTIMDSNRVIVLDKGEIVEFDDPTSLLKNSQSIFYDMCKSAGIV